jgi:hypothetical protein
MAAAIMFAAVAFIVPAMTLTMTTTVAGIGGSGRCVQGYDAQGEGRQGSLHHPFHCRFRSSRYCIKR